MKATKIKEKPASQGQRSSKNLSPDKIYHATTILSEINMHQISFFSTQQFVEGQSIIIEFQIPQTFAVSAEVLRCRSYSMKSCIITSQKLIYRGRAKFTFLRPAERAFLQKFIISVAHNGPKSKAKKKTQSPKQSPGESKENQAEEPSTGVS